jgi:hypothetical protein
MQLAIQALRKEAASAGATGVIILKSQQVPVGGGSTERRMIGAAIRREN